MAEAAFADPVTRERFEEMVRRTEETEPVPDDFSWISPVLRLQRGDRVRFRDASDHWHEGRALGAARWGHSMAVIPVIHWLGRDALVERARAALSASGEEGTR